MASRANTDGAPLVVHARFGGSRVLSGPPFDPSRLSTWCGLAGAEAPGLAETSDEFDSLYESFHEKGLAYGPAFQTLVNFKFAEGGAVARLRRENDGWESQMQLLSPALLDGALQLLVEAASRKTDAGEDGKRPTFLPFSVRRAVVAASCPAGELWAGVKVSESTGTSLTADIEVFSATGQLAVRLEGAVCRKAEGATALEGDGSDQCLFEVDWIPAELGTSDPEAKILLAGGRGLPFAEVLGLPAAKCTAATVAEAVQKVEDGSWSTVIYEATGSDIDAVEGALLLLQALIALGDSAAQLVLVTVGTQVPELGA